MRFQENIYEKIMYNLNEDNLVLLYGPLGCGKSKLINEHFKKDYSSYFEFKEIDKNRNDALPLIAVSNALSDDLNNEKENVDILNEMSGKKIPLKYLFNKTSKIIRFFKSLNNYLTDTEINIVLGLKNRIKQVKKGAFTLFSTTVRTLMIL